MEGSIAIDVDDFLREGTPYMLRLLDETLASKYKYGDPPSERSAFHCGVQYDQNEMGDVTAHQNAYISQLESTILQEPQDDPAAPLTP